MLNLFKNKDVKGYSLESELERLLDTTMESSNIEVLSASNLNNIDKKFLLETLTRLIFLLTRKRSRNSFHMHMIMYLIEEVEKYSISCDELQDNPCLVQSTNILLKSCLETMNIAEKETFKAKDINDRFVFKDEKYLIKEFFKRQK